MPGVYQYIRIGQEWLADEFIPVDNHHALCTVLGASNQFNTFSELVDSKTTNSLLAKRQTIAPRPAKFPALNLPMVMGWHKPNVSDRLDRHPITIVLYDNMGIGCVYILQGDSDILCVCVIGVLYQFKYRQAWSADELITQELKQACPRPKR